MSKAPDIALLATALAKQRGCCGTLLLAEDQSQHVCTRKLGHTEPHRGEPVTKIIPF